MPTLISYRYRARNPQGVVVQGYVQSVSIDAARKLLVKEGYTPLLVALPPTLASYLPFLNSVGLKTRSVFFRQLSTMLTAGLSISQALRLLMKQTRKGRFESILQSILTDVQDGFSFSTALGKFPDVFDVIAINVVRSGEATGKLEEVLTKLATDMEKEVAIVTKIKSALFYPAFVIFAMLATGYIMVTKVIPQLKDVFESSGGALPSQTVFLLNLSDFLINQWYVLPILLVLAVIGGRWFLRTDLGQEFSSHAVLKIPLIKQMVTESSMSRFARLLGLLLHAGVPMLEALRLITDSYKNRVYQRAIAYVAVQVERGVAMSIPVSENPAFPILVGQMVAVGEQTGKMDEIMERMGKYYEDELDGKVSAISSLIEPFIILLLGFGVAYLVIAVLLPIYQLSSNIG
jgi:type IV pilus assembly protein PilC